MKYVEGAAQMVTKQFVMSFGRSLALPESRLKRRGNWQTKKELLTAPVLGGSTLAGFAVLSCDSSLSLRAGFPAVNIGGSYLWIQCG